MAEIQMPTVVRSGGATRRPAIFLAVLSALLVVAIAVAMVAGGVVTRSSSVRQGDFGSREWVTFRSGERGPLMGPAGTAAGATGSVADPLLSQTSIDFRLCERDGC
jgi:hypothetical protein